MTSILVTGATGFLGGALARRCQTLLESQELDATRVVATGRSKQQGERLAQDGLTFSPADLTDAAAVTDLVRDADLVFHCAALSSPWGAREAFVQANVVATRHLVEASLAAGVKRFVHISTPGIYHDGTEQRDIREDHPLPTPYNAYAATKREAEEVVQAAVQRGLSAIILRPRALFGPGDTTLFPRVLRAMKKGVLPVIGKGDNLVDLTYIDNVVDAALLAARAPETLNGRCYNITNDEPTPLWPLLQRLARELDCKPPTKRVPRALLMATAGALEQTHRRFKRAGEPALTRYGVSLLSTTITLDISAARRELGYNPRVSVEEGVQRFLEWWKQCPR